MSPYRDGFFVFSESRSEVLALCMASVCVTNSTLCVPNACATVLYASLLYSMRTVCVSNCTLCVIPLLCVPYA
jgi:hypothetical protein